MKDERASRQAIARMNRREGVPAEGPRCLVVMYHYVHPADSLLLGTLPALTPEDFGSQLDELCAVMEPIDWPRLFAWTQHRAAIPERCFLATFDDGLSDHFHHVVPLLQKRGLRGTFFVPGCVLTGQHLLSAHAIHLLLATLGDEEFASALNQKLAVHTPRENWWVSARDADARVLYHYETPVRARLKYLLTIVLPTALRDVVVEEMFAQHIGSSSRWARQWYMQWDQVKELESLGHTVGGHGFAHESYARMSEAEIRQDVARVDAVLREGLGPDLRPFSYPYGGVNYVAQKICEQAGFAHAFTTESLAVTEPLELLALPRVDTIHVATHITKESTCPQR